MAYLLPLASSLLYVLAVLFLKQASERGVGLARTTLVTNILCGLFFSGLVFLGGRVPEPALWHQPVLVGLIFLAAQVLGFTAIQRGDVSVATPVMGVKVVLVALGVTLLIGQRVPPAVWAAAGLSSAGVLFLNRGGSSTSGRAGPALLFGALAAAAFALFDVLTQKWSPLWGAGRFLPAMMGCVAVCTVLGLALFRVPLGPLPPEARRPLLLGGFFMSVQAVMLICAIAIYGRATTINVVYSARGLWSVLAVWTVGHWFGNKERDRGASVLRARLFGAALLLAAVALAVFAR